MNDNHVHAPRHESLAAPSGHAGQPEPRPPHGKAAHGAHDNSGGHDRHAGHSVAMFRNRFWISLALTIPTIVWGHMLARLTGNPPPAVPGSHWVAPVFGTAVFFYGGWVFLQGAARELKNRLPGMMTLISLAITVAFVISAAVTLGITACGLRRFSSGPAPRCAPYPESRTPG